MLRQVNLLQTADVLNIASSLGFDEEQTTFLLRSSQMHPSAISKVVDVSESVIAQPQVQPEAKQILRAVLAHYDICQFCLV